MYALQCLTGKVDNNDKIKNIYICISYNICKKDLPDIYALARGSQARGCGYIYQANPNCPCYK